MLVIMYRNELIWTLFSNTLFQKFVPFQKIFASTNDEDKMKAKLAEQVLEEIPEQLVSYMKMVQYNPAVGTGRKPPIPVPRGVKVIFE